MGLTEAHQVLAMNKLRERVTLRTDGGLRTGRDVLAAMMGAEEYGIGTAALIAMGCIMVRQCQSNTCPVGVCTQDEKLREKFTGTADKVVNLITFYAQELREQLAAIGARSLDEVIGRADLLTQVSRGAAHLDDLDLNPLLITVDGAAGARYDRTRPRTEVPDTLDAEILHDAEPFLPRRREDAAVLHRAEHAPDDRRARLQPYRPALRPANDLQPDHLTVKLTGSAGQSLGAFAAPG
jgi:glutamate synthase (NADPH/NADH) large chain